jgi:formate hydrogenlyase subunit 3/multisubunit Na+/H+ antiporter MnhD subunit
MITGPLLLIALPLTVAPLIWLLRRWATIAALLSAGISLLMALMAWRLPLDQPVQLGGRQVALGESVFVLGRELVMSQTDRMDLAFIFLIASGLFLFAWRVSQGWTFFPLGMALLAVLSGALLVESHIFSVLLLQIAAALCVFLIQGGQVGSTRGSLRFLTFVTLAIPPILITSWVLAGHEQTPDDTSLLDTSTLLFAFGFAVLLGVVPFHTWVPAVSTDAPPLVSTFILGIFYAVVWFIMLDLIESFEWLASHSNFRTALNYSGYAMIAVGGIMAAVQQRLGRLMGYATLVDMGAAQLALGLGTSAGLNAALLGLGTRVVSLTLMAMGISLIRHRAEGDNFDRLVGWGRHLPWATAALTIGGLSLAGLPPGAGFAVRWSITRLIAGDQAIASQSLSGQTSAVLLLLASAAIGIGVVRALIALLREPTPEYVGSEIVEAIEAASKPKQEQKDKLPEPEPRLATAIIIAGLIFCLALGLVPQFHTRVISQVARSYTFLDLIPR